MEGVTEGGREGGREMMLMLRVVAHCSCWACRWRKGGRERGGGRYRPVPGMSYNPEIYERKKALDRLRLGLPDAEAEDAAKDAF